MPNDLSNAFPSLPGSLSNLVGSGTQAFLQSLSQTNRLITLETPLPAAAFIVERFHGNESINDLFRFDIHCLSTSAHFELKDLIKQEVTLRILLADGSTRAIHGMVVRAAKMGSDGALTRYAITILPWLHRMLEQRDSYVFQDKTVLEIAEEIFKRHPSAQYRIDVQTPLPKRSRTTQFRETEFEFVSRILAEEGINFYFEHPDAHARDATTPSRAVDQTSDANSGHAKHVLVLFDSNDTLKANSQATIRYHRTAATEESDTITKFAQRQFVQSNAVALSSWDYKKLVATSSEDSVASKPDDVPVLEVYRGADAYQFTDEQEAAHIAHIRAEALQCRQMEISGESSVRTLLSGTTFTMTNYGDDLLAMASSATSGQPNLHEYLVVSIEHSGANNVTGGMADIRKRHDTENGTYRNKFTCLPRTIPIRPEYVPKPTAPATDVALVVGVEGQTITAERDHRIKIQFPWQRGERALPGQGMHPHASNAPGDESCGTWVRKMEQMAGANWGSNFMSRIGDEVQVQYINGDIDRPVVTGCLYSPSNAPPFHGGDNHPGVLSGFQTQEIDGNGGNTLVMDDTPNQLRQTFATTTAAAQLNVGYLIKQDGNQRGSYRGSGLELTTDAWSTLRARQGLFITTAPRSGATSTQLDTQEAQGKLKAAEDLSKALSDASTQHQAAALSTPNGLQALTNTISDKQQADGQDAPAFAAPIALIDSEAGISVTTAASALTFAGQDLTWTAHSALRMTAGQVISMTAGKGVSLFTHAGGAKVIAANSPVSLQAHTGAMDIIADQAMTITSSNGSIKIQAKDEILLASGGGYIKLSGSNIDIACPSTVSVKGASHDFMGAASVAATLQELPSGAVSIDPPPKSLFVKYDEAFIIRDPIGKEMASVPYRIEKNDGKHVGKTGKEGNTNRIATTKSEQLKFAMQWHSVVTKK
ncbi:MAG TPA: type VI secretion system Vgr family protein [Burkholderiaceae bacterium]|jgi:type VI secretion system secreted protein VgrG